MGNGRYQLTSAGRSANHGQIGPHWLGGNFISHVGGFSFFVFLNPWTLVVKFWIVVCLGKDFLVKSSLVGCALKFHFYKKEENEIFGTKKCFLCLQCSFKYFFRIFKLFYFTFGFGNFKTIACICFHDVIQVSKVNNRGHNKHKLKINLPHPCT